jgi:orotidine-5'-phosphate decarboxylase
MEQARMSNTKFNARANAINSLLCVGLDANIDQIPARFKSSATPQFDFNRWIIDQTHEYACAYKPNMAFYEARGSRGWDELALTAGYLHHNLPDAFTICDAKRGDIGNTNEGYVRAIFDEFHFDAITLHPYLGAESLAPFLNRTDKTSIILCRTSNPNSGELQDLLMDGKPLWHIIAERVRDSWNANQNCMLVVGATYPEEMRQVRATVGDAIPFLVPGIGAQGGDVAATVQAGQDSNGGGLVISASRGIIFAESPSQAAKSFRDEINQYRLIPS